MNITRQFKGKSLKKNTLEAKETKKGQQKKKPRRKLVVKLDDDNDDDEPKRIELDDSS